MAIWGNFFSRGTHNLISLLYRIAYDMFFAYPSPATQGNHEAEIVTQDVNLQLLGRNAPLCLVPS